MGIDQNGVQYTCEIIILTIPLVLKLSHPRDTLLFHLIRIIAHRYVPPPTPYPCWSIISQMKNITKLPAFTNRKSEKKKSESRLAGTELVVVKMSGLMAAVLPFQTNGNMVSYI